MKCNKAASAKIVFGFFNTVFFVSIKFYFASLIPLLQGQGPQLTVRCVNEPGDNLHEEL